MMRRLLLLIVFALCGGTVCAQQVRSIEPAPTAMEASAYIGSLRTAERSSRSTYSNAQHVEDLIAKVQPSVYFYSGTVKTYGEKPRVLFTDLNSLGSVNDPAILKNNIEMVAIKLSSAADLNSTIDLSVFSVYKNLKYIYIVSNLNTTVANINRMVGTYGEKYSVFYKIDNGEKNQ